MSNKQNIVPNIIPKDEIKLENTTNFKCLCIKPSNIEQFDWKNPNYLTTLLNQPFYESIDIEPNNLIEKIAIALHIDEYKSVNINNYVICENKDYICEILFLDVPDEFKTKEHENQMASLINISGDKIYGYAFLLKTYIPIKTQNMYFKDNGLKELHKILYDRVNTTVVLYEDENLREEKIFGNMKNFAGDDKYKYKKVEFPFLLHNINIWYLPDEYGEENVCGKLIDKKIEKCIWFSMNSELYRGHISLDEVQKIIKLSYKLEKDFKPDKEWIKDEMDKYNRKIVKNKYRILEKAYNIYFPE